MDSIISLANSLFVHWLLLVFSVTLILFALLMLYGIKKKGKIFILSPLLKNKQLDNEKLNRKYIIQGIYTIFIGILLFITTAFYMISQYQIFIILIFFAILDAMYDYFAIKKSMISK